LGAAIVVMQGALRGPLVFVGMLTGCHFPAKFDDAALRELP
jgi:hypothetical protein